MRLFYDTEREIVVTEQELIDDFECMSMAEREQYRFKFGNYLRCCLTCEGGTLEEIH